MDRTTGAVSSVAVKAPVKCTTAANVATLSGAQTVNGTALVTDDRVLLKNQTDQTDNGIWVVDTGAWSRAKDFDASEDIITGTMVFSVAQLKFYYVTSANNPTIDTDNITFSQAPVDTSGATAYFQTLFAAADASTLRGLIEITRIAFATGAGTVDIITAAFSPTFTAFDQTAVLIVEATGANTSTTPTLTVDALAAKTIVKGSNTALVAGDIPGANFLMMLRYDTSLGKFQLLNPANPQASVTASVLAGSALAFVGMVNGTIVQTRAASAETFAIKTLAGADPSAGDPVLFIFRDQAATTGGYVLRTVTAALSLTISSGSTLGCVNAEAFRLWLVAFDDAATVRLGVVKTTTGSNAAGWKTMALGAWGVASSTAEGGAGAADSAQVIYTGSAVASKPYALIGNSTWESGLAAVGTWGTAPSRIQIFGHGTPVPGAIVAQVMDRTTAVNTTASSAIPFDDTIPQNTEGGAVITGTAFLPTSSANLLMTTASLFANTITDSNALCFALFRDAGADAIAATGADNSGASSYLNLVIEHAVLATATTSTQFLTRCGNAVAAVVTINGVGGGRIFGGVAQTTLKTVEIMA